MKSTFAAMGLCLGLLVATNQVRAATYTVINTNDSGGGSLRWAITSALSSAPPNVVAFNIPGAGPHEIVITGTQLPNITNATSIRGDSQPGYTNTPLIVIRGPSTSVFGTGLIAQHNSAHIRGVRVTGFFQGIGSQSIVNGCVIDDNGVGIVSAAGVIGGSHVTNRNIIINNHTNGISIFTNSTVVIRGNFIGVEADGVTPAPNGENGIRLNYASGITIEGHPDYPQVISGHTNGAGILLAPNGGYVWMSSANTIRGNYIGTDVTGSLAVPNKIGIWSWGGAANNVGGTSSDHRNIIAGNLGAGVLFEGFLLISPTAYNNQLRGNYIGLAADGMTPLPNDVGVQILNGMSNVVGGVAAGQGNRFGVSDFYQVYISASSSALCYSNVVQGNWIGVTTGNTVIAGGQTGIYILNASNNVIGGTTSTARNVIGGAGTGIYITGPQAQGNRVLGNTIGSGPAGELFPNNSYGINIFNAARNLIGGAYTNEGNTISGNQFYGVFIQGTGSFNNVVAGNRIGTDPTATFSVSNRYTGVNIAGGAFSNLVGGTDYSRANVVAGNGGTGVRFADPNTTGNQVSYNFIGMNTNFAAITNSGYGVEIFNASSNLVGGANYIGNSGTPYAGIRVSGTNSYDNIVYGNTVGMDNAGNPHPNYGGIDVQDARNTIVGFSLFTGNLVGGNNNDGISVRGVASGTQVRVNFVGVGAAGTNRVPNTGDGVYVDAPDTVVGGIGFGNIISGNNGAGIFVGRGGTNAVIQGNFIGPDVSGSFALTNNGTGVRVDAAGVLVGGTNVAARNVIAGNNVNGVDIQPGARDVVVQGNYIGLNQAGTLPVSNRQYGVIISGATNIVIGGTGTARNVISASRLTGLTVGGASSNVLVVGNYIGLNASATSAIPNGTTGVGIDASDVTIGGAGALGNVISGNGSYGIEINTGRNARVLGNTIGLAANGTAPVPNGAGGLRIRGVALGVLVGGTNSADANVIARNGGSTEFVIDGPSAGHQILGNFIGVQRFGVTFTDHDASRGLFINNAPSNRIAGNVFGQLGEPLYIGGTGSFANVVQGNFIGEYSLEPMTNSSWGVIITNARNTVLGGFTAEERNLITRNNGGVLVTGTNAINNDVARNLIYGNSARLNIDLGPLGFNADDVNDPDLGANLLQNRPRLTNGVTVSPSSFVYAQGVLTSAPSTTYAIDLFRADGTNASAFRYLGRTFSTTDAGGVGFFSAGLPVNLSAGQFLCATATDPDGNTSELAVSPAGVTAVTTADGDNDGIPGYWETLYGLNPAVSNAPTADADGDGIPDVQEFIADTAANDSNAFPVVTWIAGETSGSVTFPSSPVRVYSLQANGALDTGAWTQVGGSITGLYGETTIATTNSADGLNYRTAVRLP